MDINRTQVLKRATKFAKDLKTNKMSLMEEARAIQSLHPRRFSSQGLTLQEIGKIIERSYIWVHTRMVLLKLPEEVQKAADEGIFRTSEIKLLMGLPQKKWPEVALRILADRREGLAPNSEDLKHRKTRKTYQQIRTMINNLKHRGAEDLILHVLGWVLGDFDAAQIYHELGDLNNENNDRTYS
jgi:hypothetical protein